MKTILKKAMFSIGFIILLFIMTLEVNTDIQAINFVSKHIDEIITVLLGIYCLFNVKLIYREKKTLLILWIVFLLIGTLSTLVYHYQPILPSVIDALLISSRFIIGYFAMYAYSKKNNTTSMEILTLMTKILVIVFFLLTLHDILFEPFFAKGDFRYFTNSISLMFPHPTYLATAGIVLLILLGYRSKKNLLYMLLISFVIVLTLRTKAITFIALYWIVYIFSFYIKIKRQWPIIALTGTLVVFCIAFNSFHNNYLEDDIYYRPRNILLNDSVQIMLKDFPLGSGFASYGSSVAATYYSPLYEELGYRMNYGMGRNGSTAFLSDNFWPTIFAEYGVFGTICFVAIIGYLFKLSLDKMKVDKKTGFAMMMTLAYMIITSFAETSFFNPTSLLLFMLFACYENTTSDVKLIKGDNNDKQTSIN